MTLFPLRQIRNCLIIGLALLGSISQARQDPPEGFPNAKSTGFVAAGISEDQLEPLTEGKMVITEDGFVLDKKRLTGSIFVKANNVTIKNCWISGTLGFSIRNEGKNLTIEYCKLDTAGKVEGESVAVYKPENNYTMRYCNLSGFGDGAKAGNDTLIEHNYIHDLAGDPDYHSDCIQVMAGRNIKIRNNTLQARWKMQTSVIILKNDKGAISDVSIENNFMSGGAFVFFNIGGKAIQFKNNIIEKDSWKWDGKPSYPKNAPVTEEGNRFSDETPVQKTAIMKEGVKSASMIKPVPWNGHAAAVSLTFDDSFEDHLDNAIPELDARGLKGTFFLINNDWYKKRKADWAKAAASGHEIGNHSRDHLDPKIIRKRSQQEWEADILGWRATLEKDLNTQVTSYAHPFCNSPDYTVDVIKNEHFMARECGGNFLIPFDKEPTDWLRIEGRSTTGISQETITHEVTNALKQGKWITYYFHSIAGPWKGFPMKDFKGTLDFLKAKNVWVDSYSNIGGYLKASLILSKAKAQKTDEGQTIKWAIPESFPKDIIVRVTLTDTKGWKLYQDKQVIIPDARGYYSVNFNAGALRLKTEN